MTDGVPALDVLIPYFGSRALLEEAVRSVLDQDHAGWRLTVVEDGDQAQGVGPWLASLGDDRVRFAQNPRTLGVAGNFQRCLDLAEAELVTWLGCDDRLLPSYVRTVLDLAHRFPTADAHVPGVRVIDGTGRPARTVTDSVKAVLRPHTRAPRDLCGEQLLVSLLHGNWTYFPATCWKRRTVAAIGFRPELPITLDLALLARVVLDGGTVSLSPDVVFEYRRHTGSASTVAAREAARFAEERGLFVELAAECAAKGWPRAERAARWHLTSRAHALLELPRALGRGSESARSALRHVVAR